MKGITGIHRTMMPRAEKLPLRGSLKLSNLLQELSPIHCRVGEEDLETDKVSRL